MDDLKVQPQSVPVNDLLEGYRETELGPLPEDWEVVQLGALFEIQQGKALSKKSRTGKSPRPFLRTANVLWSRVDVTTLDTMDFTDKEAEKLSLLPGDLLVCEGGDIGRTAMWQGEVEGCSYQNHVHRLRTSRPDVQPAFYMYWMQAALRLLSLYGGAGNKTTIPNLSKTRLGSFSVPLLPLPEQQAIAHVLRTVQKAIEATQRVIEATRELKRSLMNYLFTYGPVPVDEAERVPLKETEIGFVPDHWEVVKLGDVCERFQYGTSERSTIDGPGAPVLRIPNVIGGDIDTHDLKYAKLPEKTADKLKLSVGDVLFVRTNGRREYTGRCAVFQGEPVGALFASYLIRAQLEKDIVLPAFLQSYTETTAGRQWLSGRASEAADGKYNLNTQILKDVSLPLPSLVEQDQLTSSLEAIDAKIAVETNRERTLEILFKTLLHNLMTGKVRVTDLDLSEAGELV